MEKTTLYLPRALQARLREKARRTGSSQAELVRAALERDLADEELSAASFVGIGDDPGLDARDSEEWLEREWGGD